jgi:hypothetical protein
VFGAGFEHVDLVILQDHLGLNDLQALRAETIGEVVVDVRAIMAGRIHSLDILFKWGRDKRFLPLRFTAAHGILLLIPDFERR